MAEEQKQRILELDCAAIHAVRQTYSPTLGSERGLFSCYLGPLPDETIVALDQCARARAPVRLLFDKGPLLLNLIKAELTDTQRVRIVGIVIQTSLATA